MKITKKNGIVSVYDDQKVIDSILKANASTKDPRLTANAAAGIAGEVFAMVTENNEIITTKDVRNCVLAVLRRRNLTETARCYEEYRK